MNTLYYLTNMTSIWMVTYTLFGIKKNKFFLKSGRALWFAENISRYANISSVLVFLDNKYYRKYK